MEKLRRFMYGRYGTDSFNLFLLFCGLLLVFLAQIFRFFPLTLVSYLLYGYALFRMLSKNYAARRKENDSFMKLWTPIQKWCKIRVRAFQERKQYKYFCCPNCHQQLRAPRKRGKILVTCQTCHKQFNQRT